MESPDVPPRRLVRDFLLDGIGFIPGVLLFTEDSLYADLLEEQADKTLFKRASEIMQEGFSDREALITAIREN